MRLKILVVLFFVVFNSCKDEDEISKPLPTPEPDQEQEHEQEDPQVDPPGISVFRIDSIDFIIDGDQILGRTPVDIENRSALVATFEAEGIVTINGVEQVSGETPNDFSVPVVYTVTNSVGTTKQYTVKYATFTGLARMYITTDGTRITKEEYIEASFRLDPNHQYDADILEVEGRIRGRGNTTWRMPKKPYKIKFDSRTSLLNMPRHKTWVLLANYIDKTLIRNYLALDLSKKLNFPFSPACHFMEVYLNGVHQGNYMLSEQVEVAVDRVDITEMGPSDEIGDRLTGGYLLEIDRRVLSTKDEPYFESNAFPIVVKSPDEPTESQMEYISNYIMEAEGALYGENFIDPENGFRKYFDEVSMIKWFIVAELFKNVDSRNFSSIYFYKDRGGKINMGPMWDFDMAAGNASHCRDCMRPTGWHVMRNPWFSRMYEDPAFKAQVKKLWNQYKPEIDAILPKINELAEYLDESQQRNFELWPKFSDPGATVQNIPDFEGHVAYLHNFLSERISWMDQEINN